MTRARFRYTIGSTRFDGPRSRTIIGLLGVGLVTAAIILGQRNGDHALFVGLYGNFGAYGTLFLFHASGLTERYLTNYVELTLGHVTWRLPNPNQESFFVRRRRVALAQVRDIKVGLLAITFRLRDGREEVLPLGMLPYAAVQEVKARFEGEASLRTATAGALAGATPGAGLTA